MATDNNYGGARPGAGRPKGSMDESTKLRMAAEKKYKERVAKMTDRLLNAQSALALGEVNLYVKTKKGNKTITSMITDVEIVKQYINGDLDDSDNEYYYLATKSPDNKALDSMMDRTYGKARQSVDVTSGDEPIQSTEVSDALLLKFKEFMLETTKGGAKPKKGS